MRTHLLPFLEAQGNIRLGLRTLTIWILRAPDRKGRGQQEFNHPRTILLCEGPSSLQTEELWSRSLLPWPALTPPLLLELSAWIPPWPHS